MKETDVAADFAQFVQDTRFEDLPKQVVEATKRSILDTIGVIFAGSGLGDVQRIVAMVQRWGGAPQATVLGYDSPLPAPHAAFLNGVMTHQLDFDDTHDAAVAHPTANSLPVALALAEADGTASGADLIRAVALGNDIVCRLGLAIRGSLFDYPWTRPPIIGIYGATTAGAAMLGLRQKQIEWAFGLTLHQTANTLECLHSPGSSVRGLRDGFSCRNGVFSSEMARAGIAGDRNSFEGRFGLFNAYFRGEYDRRRLLEGLGTKFHGVEVSIKPWPSARETHATIQAIVDLIDRTGATAEAVSEVVLHVGKTNLEFCEPLELRRRPATRIDALRSLPYLVAAAILHGRLSVEAFHDERIGDPGVLAIAERVSCRHDFDLDAHGTIEGGRVEIVMRDGSRYENSVRHAAGHPDVPLAKELLIGKFRDCVGSANAPFDEEATERLIDVIERLEGIEVSELASVLSPERRR